VNAADTLRIGHVDPATPTLRCTRYGMAVTAKGKLLRAIEGEERDVVSRVSIHKFEHQRQPLARAVGVKPGDVVSQPNLARAESVMSRHSHVPREQVSSSHQRDLPSRGVPEDSGSGQLGLMVGGYLMALFGGILLLGALTPTSPIMSVVVTDTVRTN
jgi:hypothetical protein